MSNKEEKLKVALARANMSMSELARQLGTTPQNLSIKVKRNTLTDEDMMRIAGILGCEWTADFVYGG